MAAGYLHGTVTVGAAAVLLVSAGYSSGGVLVQNQGAEAVWLGGPTVTANTAATGGIQVPAGASVTVPTTGSGRRDLYAVAVTGPAPVTWLTL